jgi:hypothetical protein
LPPIDTVYYPWKPVAGQWYHVAVTRDGNIYTLYIDGAQVAKDTNYKVIPDPRYPLTIGRAEHYYFDGLIDEVEMHDRALSAEEIQAIYEAGSAGKCKPGAPDKDRGHGNDIGGIDEDNPGKGCENKNENGNRKRCP